MVNLSSLGKVSGLSLKIVSSDQAYGFANTPLYIAMDKVKYHREREEIETGIQTTKLKFQVYPNPFVDYIRINVSETSSFAVYNQYGQAVLNGLLQAGENEVSTSTLPNGIYLLKCGNETIKIVK